MNNEELVGRIQAGEQNLLVDLWQQVEKFVAMRARTMAEKTGGRYGVTAEDLYQSGYLALVSAVETYSSAADCKFLTWLDYHLRTEFAQWGGWRTERQKRDPLHRALCLDSPPPGGDEDGNTLADLQPDPAGEQPFRDIEQESWRERLRAALETALDKLPADQSETVRRRYFCGDYQHEIGLSLGVSGQRVQQLEEKALQSLRRPPLCDYLEPFVEAQTPYYYRVSVSEFQRTQTSAVERVMLIREELREMMR